MNSLIKHLTIRWIAGDCFEEHNRIENGIIKQSWGWELNRGECRFGSYTCINSNHGKRRGRQGLRSDDVIIDLEKYYWSY
jgi:hypothetical protein